MKITSPRHQETHDATVIVPIQICIFIETLVMRVIDFKTSNYFTGMPYILGCILAPAGIIVLFSGKFVIAGAMAIAGIAILTTQYRISIDFNDKHFTEYVSIFGIKTEKEISNFSVIEYVFIKRIKVSQTLNSRASSTTISKEQYEGYLRFSEQAKVHLMTLDDKNALLKKLRTISAQLNVEIFDYSDETPVKL
jgi:hypothetical protein